MSSNATQKVRVQLDLPPREATALDALRDECHLTSRTDVVRTALAVMGWVRDEAAQGRRIFAVGSDYLTCLAVPGLTTPLPTAAENGTDDANEG